MNRPTKVFASRGGERRVRTAVGLARRLADVGLRYRLRELQLLALPCLMAFVPLAWPSPAGSSIHPLVPALALCAAALLANAALSVALPWTDQHLLPPVAMLASTHVALWRLAPQGWEQRFPVLGALIALYAVVAVRLVRLALPGRTPAGRPPRRAARSWPLAAGATLLILAALLLTAAIVRSDLRSDLRSALPGAG